MLPNSRVCIYSIDNVMILDKIHKVFLYVRKFDTFKSLYWYFKLKLPRSASFHVYPKSIVDIHENANIEIKRGEFAINSSWFNTRKRRYVSELRVLNGGNMLISRLVYMELPVCIPLYGETNCLVWPSRRLSLVPTVSFMTSSQITGLRNTATGKIMVIRSL